MSSSTNPITKDTPDFETVVRANFKEAGIEDFNDPVWKPESIDGLVEAILTAHNQAVREARIDELTKLNDEHQTYAQWVIEREEPKNLDKTVVRADVIQKRIAQLQTPTNQKGGE